MASGNPNSAVAAYLFIARLHLSWKQALLRKTMELEHWFVLVIGSLATFRLSHMMTKERGPLAIFERIRNVMPGGRGSAREWISCIWCFSLSASALVCLVLWSAGFALTWHYWILFWLSFSSVSLLVNKACG